MDHAEDVADRGYVQVIGFDAAKLALIGLMAAVVLGVCAYALHRAYDAGWTANEAAHERAIREKNAQIEEMNKSATEAYDDLDRARSKVAANALSGDIPTIDAACAIRASYPPVILQQLNAIR